MRACVAPSNNRRNLWTNLNTLAHCIHNELRTVCRKSLSSRIVYWLKNVFRTECVGGRRKLCRRYDVYSKRNANMWRRGLFAGCLPSTRANNRVVHKCFFLYYYFTAVNEGPGKLRKTWPFSELETRNRFSFFRNSIDFLVESIHRNMWIKTYSQ